MKESVLQAKIIKWLEEQGCMVVKYNQNGTTRAGMPDILFWYEWFYGAIEVKRNKHSKFQPLQKRKLKRFEEWSYGRVWDEDNYTERQKELQKILEKIDVDSDNV